MLRAALRDLQWRWKRFVIAMIGVALVFAMGLIMTALTASFSLETGRTLHAIGAERWAVAADASGPFTSSSLIPTSTATDSGGSPVMVLRETITTGSKVRDIIMMGVEQGQLGSPNVKRGDGLAAAGQVVVDASLPNVDIGDDISIGGKDFQVVGETSHQSLFAGIPLVYVSLADAQNVAVLGQPLATTLLFDHVPTFVSRDLKVLTNAEVKADVLRPLTAARSSIGFVRLLLWLVAAIVIGSVLYLQALERTRDFAVFKATGTSTAAIGAGLALQAVMLSLAAAVLAAILATFLAPLFPLHVEIPTSAYLLLPVITVVVGLLACSIALRRTARVDPALAFGG
ncbi:MAG TPA: ABC transporter permease [Ilumatobacteraceae bacterium]|nr:ABC transporter permease [Ilumatobacteraceae bacterium]